MGPPQTPALAHTPYVVVCMYRCVCCLLLYYINTAYLVHYVQCVVQYGQMYCIIDNAQ
jgi:hypothetical protein